MYKDLDPIIKAYKEYRDLVGNIAEAKEILSESDDAEMKEMAKMELDENLPRKDEMDEEIKVLLIPKDPADAKKAKNMLKKITRVLWGQEKLKFVLEELLISF